MRYLSLIAVLFLAGCSHKPKTYTYKDVGALVTIDLLNTNFNDRVKTQIVTDKGTFIIYGETSGMKGARVLLRNDGYLFVGDYGYPAAGYWHGAGRWWIDRRRRMDRPCYSRNRAGH